MKNQVKTTLFQKIFRILLGCFILYAGISHLSFNRMEFQAQVPDWVPLGKDLVVIISGVIEIILGLAMLFWSKQRVKVGWALAIFFVLIFPGNISQYLDGKDAFGDALNSDKARLIRLFFQPVLIVWALWSTCAWKAWRERKK